MPKKSSEVSLGQCLWIVLCFILMISIVIGSVGTAFYVKEKYNQSIYKPTMCFVQNYSLIESKCPKQECSSSSFSQSCTTVYYISNLDTYVIIL
jgi:low temperature requirement protein LtrA